MSEALTSLRKLSNLNVRFSVSFESSNGAQELSATPEQLIEILNNPVKGYAQILGVSEQDYLMCHDEEFNVQCSADTKSGKRCRNIVKGGHAVNIKQWVKLHGEYCPIHGGE